MGMQDSARTVTLVAAICFAATALVAQTSRTAWDGVYTDAQAARGAALYTAQCANCHGATLGGVEAAPALTGTVFLGTWDGVSLGELAERIRVSMPQTDPGSLSRRETADVLAYMLQAGRFPAGAAELPADAAALGAITLRAARP